MCPGQYIVSKMVTPEISHMRSLLKGKAEVIIYFWIQYYQDLIAYVSEYHC